MLSAEEEHDEPMITDENEDVAKFDGKIVYNPDGSAYILEDDNLDILLPKHDGSIIDRSGASPVDEYLPIANAFYVSKGDGNTNLYNALVKNASTDGSNAPVVHSYRVYSARGGVDLKTRGCALSSSSKVPLSLLSVPIKPILMCFICKLSFGCSKSFMNHGVSDHDILLTEEERSILDSKHSSAIIQTSGKNKEALVSFLEPVNPDKSSSSGAISSPNSSSSFSKVPPPSLCNDSDPNGPASSYMRPPSVKSHSEVDNFSSAASQLGARRTPDSERSCSGATPNEMAAAMMAAAAAASRKSPSGSISPAMTVPSSLSSPSPIAFPTNANMLQGTTIGACPDHVNGRPTGIECPKCDLILNASRMPGGIAWNTSRNSCKTLKCPKCNWHYKYQETLEIHMKEKHPDNETTCIYCITGQQHPRLARGETYTCGYKPYRCEVCNYSTTTKGNLSIHMQSDKHLNNMQELQNGGGSVPPSSSSAGGPLENNNSSSPNSPKVNPPLSSPSIAVSSPQNTISSVPKPNWRCDICNYETNVARNLRIHMTSEKHTQNVLALQQNAKNISALTHQMSNPVGGPTDPKQQLLQGFGLLAAAAASSNPDASAMADLAYNQALLTQLIQQQQSMGLLPNDHHVQDVMMNNEAVLPPKPEVDPNPRYLFTCCVCNDFGSDSLEPLSAHLSSDRTKSRENEVSLVIAGNYLCQLCNYKTNLKANFQLHCKTDKHLQRLNHVNHIKEGGPGNEWKLRFLSNVNPVELRCNACDFFTNSPHKLQVHVASQQHQISSVLFAHLQKSEERLNSSFGKEGGEDLNYECLLCQFSAKGKHLLLNHVRSMKHLQMEQIHQLQKRAEGNLSQTDIGDIFRVSDDRGSSNKLKSHHHHQHHQQQGAEELTTSSTSSVSNHHHTHNNSDHKTEKRTRNNSNNHNNNNNTKSSPTTSPSSCPLCSEKFTGQDSLEDHASAVHSVNAEGIARLQSLINGSHWLNNENKQVKESSEEENMEVDEESKGSHNDEGPSSSSPFQDPSNCSPSSPSDKYQDPSRPFKCDICRESFTQKNILLVHYNSVSHLNQLKKSSTSDTQQPLSIPTPEKSPSKGSALEALLGNIKKDTDDEVKPYKCNICKVAYTQGSTLDIHIRSVLHQTKASKLQELILSGQIDLSKPLIEQPDPQQIQDQHKKMLTDMLSPKSLNSTGSSNPQSSPNVRSSSPINQSSPQSSPLATSLSQKNASSPEEHHHESANPDAIANFVKNFMPGGDGKAVAAALSSIPDAKKASSPVLKNLLSNFGFDFMMQFNDIQQKKARIEEEEESEETTMSRLSPKKSSSSVEEEDKKFMTNEQNRSLDSEAFRYPCPICKKGFLSSWSLKSHTDEAHKDIITQELLEKYIDKLRSEQNHLDEEMPVETAPKEHSSISREDNSPQSPSVRSSTPHATPQQPPNLLEMQEVIQRAMMQQMNPMMMQMAQLQGLNPLAAMNLYPPLIPPGLLPGSQNMHGGMLDPKVLALMAAGSNKSPEELKNLNPHAAFMQMLAQQQQQQQQTASSLAGNNKMPQIPPMEPFSFPPTPPDAHHLPKQSASLSNQSQQPAPVTTPSQETGGKRARTRISDDQLKILRSHFDINNSPAEETLNLMSSQTGLPLKVIKHWFRNTLFKERQKNKDSPYNFSNPPSTKLNLEEYEKSGETKITPLKPEEQGEYIQNELKKEVEPEVTKNEAKIARASSPESNISDSNHSKTDIPSDSNGSSNLTLSRLLAAGGSPLPPNLLPNFPAFPTNPAAMPNYLSNLANRMSQEMNNSVPRPHSPQQSCGGSQTNSSGKRANRTRFTDYQIKVLQEFFENNAYPKDDDLEYLSKLLGLSPRVIVVWFQNARQKARKIYENQPAGNECSPVASNTSSSSVSGAVGATVAVMSNNNADSDSEQNNAGRFTRTPGLNYQCKKCLLVFQRYYELIRHQKQHCYKEEDAKRSAQAQKAAGVAAAQYVGQYNSNNSEDSNHSNDRSVHSPLVNEEDLVRQYVGNNPFLSGAFQQQSQHQQQSQALNQQQTSNHHSGHDEEIDEDMENESDENSLCSTPSSSKRKLSDDGTELDAEELQNREKRLRTTITQEQLDFLYQKYQSESNPSRKSLEQIAGQVGLRKRVVQVWFQNTRARERKGLYIKPELNHDENFLMKCPMCPNVSPFKSRLSWESHIGTYHPDLMENDDVVVPDSIASLIPNSASAYNLQSSMRKYYEDTMKRFMNDMQENNKEQGVGVAVGGGAVGALDLTSSDMETLSDHILDEDRDPNGDSSSQYGGNKRFRTQMTGLQIKMMKAIFENYKTPSMSECHGLGKEIGLQKRVVQVWFQNARAKEKRAKLQYSQSNGGIEPPQESVPPVPDECHICSYKYGSHYSVQDHIFSKSHLDKLRTALEAGLYEPESPGQIITGGVVAAGGNTNVSSGGNTPLGGGGGEPLQMLQINNRDLLDMTSRSNNRMMMQV